MHETSETASDLSLTILGRSRILSLALLIVLCGLGLGLRLLDLGDPPLDFHPQRQLYALTNARGLYYALVPSVDPQNRDRAIAAWRSTDHYEPRIFEGLVAVTYAVIGREDPRVPRAYASVFWVLGGLALYGLARRMTSVEGGLVALGFYLLLPFSVYASRSFQPDPLMVMGMLFTALALYRWSETGAWRWALLAGLCGGLSILVKPMAIFAVSAVATLTVLAGPGLRKALADRQVWLVGALMLVIPGLYYLGPYRHSAAGYFGTFTVAMSGLLLHPEFYVRWMNFIHTFIDLTVVFIALAGSLLLDRRGRAIAWGWWAGYGILGLFFPWQIPSHDYYSLPLVPTVALSLAPVGALLAGQILRRPGVMRWLIVPIVLLAAAYPAWIARSVLFGKNYRNEPAAWRNMGRDLPTDGPIIALTHDYGMRLLYYGMRQVTLWPYTADLDFQVARGGNLDPNFQHFFAERTRGMRYFLLTNFAELSHQPALEATLYGDYEVAQRGDGYILFDLSRRKPPG